MLVDVKKAVPVKLESTVAKLRLKPHQLKGERGYNPFRVLESLDAKRMFSYKTANVGIPSKNGKAPLPTTAPKPKDPALDKLLKSDVSVKGKRLFYLILTHIQPQRQKEQRHGKSPKLSMTRRLNILAALRRCQTPKKRARQKIMAAMVQSRGIGSTKQ